MFGSGAREIAVNITSWCIRWTTEPSKPSAIAEHEGTAGLVLRPEHEVVDEQLRTALEQVGERRLSVVGVERVLLLDAHPRQLAPLSRELVPAARVLLLRCRSSRRSVSHSSRVPLRLTGAFPAPRARRSVARERVELLREDVGAGRRVARRERSRLAVDVDTVEPVGRVVLQLDGDASGVSAASREQLRLRGGARDADALHARDVRPQRGEHRTPPARARPGDVGDATRSKISVRPR
jgi:hypothetical protein